MKILQIPLMTLFAVTAAMAVAHAETREVSLNKYSAITVYIPADIVVSAGKKPSFKMEGSDEDLAKVIVMVKNDTLILKKKKNSGRIKKINITIGMKNLKKFTINSSSDATLHNIDAKLFKLTINGSGDVVMDGKSNELGVEINGSGDVASKSFDAGNISLATNGSGDIALAGKCQTLDLGINGSGDFSGRNLTCGKVKINISGSGDGVVFASDSVQIKTSGSSDVEVYGNPKSVRNQSSGNSDLVIHQDK